MRCRHTGSRRVRVVGDRRSHLGKTEIEDLDVTARSDEDVRGLDVAMDDAGGMRGVQRVGNLDPDVDERIQARAGRRRADPSASCPPGTP